MMLKISFKSAVAFGAILAATLSSSAVSAETVLTSYNISDIRTTSPLTPGDTPTFDFMFQVFEGLVAYDDKGGIVPMLAKDYSVSADGMTYTFNLREGVKFHNGAELTADDVVFAFKGYLSAESTWRCKQDFIEKEPFKVVSITAKDQRTAVFQLNRPWSLFLPTMARIDCFGAGIFHKDSFDASGKWSKPVGTGPFALGQWKPGEFYELVAYKDYSARTEPKLGFGGNKTPLVDRVRMLTIPDPAAARAALIKGDIDVIHMVQPVDVKELQDNPQIRLSPTAGHGFGCVVFGLQQSPLLDVRMRRAIAHSLDYKAIAQVAMQGLTPPNNSFVATTSMYYDAVTATMHKTDLNLARKLVAEAGYKGEPIKVLAHKRESYVFQTAVMVQAMVKQVGINLVIETVEFGNYMNRYLEGDYTAAFNQFGSRLDPAIVVESFAGNRAVDKRKPWGDPEALSLLSKSMEISEFSERQKIFDELHVKFMNELPMINMYNTALVSASRTNVKGFDSWVGGIPRFWGVSKTN